MLIKWTWIVVFALLLVSCGVDETVKNNDNIPPDIDELAIGTSGSLEIMTWNIQTFPKRGSETVDYMVDFITRIDPDIICLQEIEDGASFIMLDNDLTEWDSFRAHSAAYDINLALLYKNTADFQVISIRELFDDDWFAFPRPPLQIEFSWNNEIFYVINNHLKASGGEENEQRRELACLALADYINNDLPNENVIITGDMNDLIIDPPDTNVFQVFLNNPDNFSFADYEIAFGSSAYWSWGNGASHLDHILISNELFAEFANSGSLIETLRLDDYLTGGWNTYDQFISDHRPVIIRLQF